MLKVYRTTLRGLEEAPALAAGCWADAVDPAPGELEQLQAQGVPAHFLRNALDLGEQPRVEREQNATLIVLRLPYARGAEADVPYQTVPLGVILADHLVVTVCRVQEDLAHMLLARQPEAVSTTQHSRFLLRLFFGVAEAYLKHLAEINQAVEGLEDRLERSLQNREVLGLLRYQKSLTYFITALRSNRLMLERLQRSHLFENSPQDLELLEDVLTETEQAIEITSIASDILSQMMDAFASIISNNLNVVMKFLAVVTVVLSVPTLIASFYGMNVGLPGEDHPLVFIAIVAVSAAISLLLLWLFRRKNWL
jgi:magnesium transporter